METWFWILGWFLSFLTIIGNGFTIFLVWSRRNLRTKTNAPRGVSLAVADFWVGLTVIPFFFLRHYKQLPLASTLDALGGCHTVLFSNTSVINLCGLVLDRFIAIVYPLNYITFMRRRRSTQVIFFSWVLTVSFNALKVILRMFYF